MADIKVKSGHYDNNILIATWIEITGQVNIDTLNKINELINGKA
jgi:hypothetical protein